MHYSLKRQPDDDGAKPSNGVEKPRPPRRSRISREEQLRLCRQAARGDEQAFRIIYDAYAPSLASYIFGVTNDRTVVEDVVNEAFLKAWRALDRFRGESDFGTWITTIARHIVFDRYKKIKDTEDLEETETIPDEGASPFLTASDNSKSVLIQKALAHLSPEHREVLQLTYMQERPIREIAELIGCPANTVKTRMFHARKKLKKIIDDMGVSYDDL